MTHKGKRQPQLATLDAVFGAVRKLYFANKPEPAPATRAQLHAALSLPATTIDDRIRTLVATGRIERPAPGKYKPVMSLGRRDGNVQISWASDQVTLTVRGHTMAMSEADAREAVERLAYFLSTNAKPVAPASAAGTRATPSRARRRPTRSTK